MSRQYGSFFILQCIAECVPPPEDRERNNLFGSIELGFSSYNLRHALVCGHLSCGVIRNWLKDDTGPEEIASNGWGKLQGASPHFLDWHEIAKMRVVGEYSGGLVVDDP